MTKIKFLKNKDNKIFGFEVLGHTDFGIEGKDVLCAAVSTLTSHTIGSIQEFSDVACENTVDEDNAKVVFKVGDGTSNEIAQAFLNAFASSIEQLAFVYPENICIEYKEVK